MEGTDGFAPGIPACSEGCEACCTAGGPVFGPSCLQLLVPALGVSGAVDTDRRAPYGGMSVDVHRDLLYGLSAAVLSGVPSVNQPLNRKYRLYDQSVQRVVFMKIKNYLHRGDSLELR
jgi:hypothetical protein